jgi:hypothetical protein
MFALLQRSFAVRNVADGVSTLILWHSCPCWRFLQRSCSVLLFGEVSTPDPLTQLPCCFALLAVPLQCTVCRGQHLILWHSCLFALPLLAAFLCSALCCRGVSTLILAGCLCCFASLQRSRCTVLQRVSALILLAQLPMFPALRSVRFAVHCVQRSSDPLTLPMFTCACRRFAAVHCVAEGQHLDPLAQLPMFVLRSCSVPLQCTVFAGVSDPLAQLPFAALLCSVPLRCTVFAEVQHSDPHDTYVYAASCSVLCGALCCRRSASDLAQLPMFALLLCGTATKCTVLQRSPLRSLTAAMLLLLASLLVALCCRGQHSDPLAQLMCCASTAFRSALCCRESTSDPLHSCACLLCASCSVPLRALCCRGVPDPRHSCPCLLLSCSVPLRCTVYRVNALILWQAAHVCFALLAAFLCSALCCRGQHSDPQLLLLLAAFLLQCTVLQRSTSDPLAQLPSFAFLQRSAQLLCYRGQHSDPLAQLPMFVCALAAFFAVTLCCRVSTLIPSAAFVTRFLQRSRCMCCRRVCILWLPMFALPLLAAFPLGALCRRVSL